jgi:REP element-mobilizing transposase RayT
MHHPPHAYLLTFRTYGTWLRGDARGSVQHHGFISHRAPLLAPSERWRTDSQATMHDEPVVLTPAARSLIDMAIRDVCEHRRWSLTAVNVRTNHVHVVLGGCDEPDRAMAAFKAWSTRRMREAGLADGEARVWARHGSTRCLWSEEAVQRAVAYVIEGQG